MDVKNDVKNDDIGMLTLERRRGEDLVIGNDVRVRVIKIDGNRVKLAVIAPRSVQVDREGGKGEPKPAA